MLTTLEATDHFCGAGGLTTAAKKAGVNVRLACNHWKLAIESHAANHTETDHYCCDITQLNPKKLPLTPILLCAPECKYHGSTAGVKMDTEQPKQLSLFEDDDKPLPQEAHVRSRMTMAEVVRFAQYSVDAGKPYQIIIVENVPEVRKWRLFPEWCAELAKLDYRVQPVYFNAMFSPSLTPQSRDRVYIVCTRKSNPSPDLDYRPRAICKYCSTEIYARQTWKKPHSPGGRYGIKNGQYYYSCPICKHPVNPPVRGAWEIIDWSLPCSLIGDRKKPLKKSTIARIKKGLQKYGNQPLCIETLRTQASGKVWLTGQTLPTLTTRQSLALTIPPFFAELYGTGVVINM